MTIKEFLTKERAKEYKATFLAFSAASIVSGVAILSESFSPLTFIRNKTQRDIAEHGSAKVEGSQRESYKNWYKNEFNQMFHTDLSYSEITNKLNAFEFLHNNRRQ